ncbi:MAG TPA: FadR/GntR family transcriptional regulator [Paracoccaceae bacterium]|nr:FadR/GntR family transcriptional regulator [Paracoccaceae bacterium]HMO72625.1 FadR/GntR family transcriptional regulator [Paracoccaceae bacterium]
MNDDAESPPDLAQRLKQFISDGAFQNNDRLPPERSLSERFGVSRGDLRKALAALEADGLIWRHVGRGTFIGARPVLNLADATYLGELASPSQVMTARIAIEPELARLAAVTRARADIEAIRHWARRCRIADDWRSYEAADNNLHHAIARATHNKLLLYLFDMLNTVRRSTVWGQKRATRRPPPDHFSLDQHDAIHDAIEARNADLAARLMRQHLVSVRDRVLPALAG